MDEATRRARELGARGEDAAAAALLARGFRVLARNVRLARGEIDLVAEDVAGLAFVEVKTRSGGRFGPPWLAVGRGKRSRMAAAAAEWLDANDRAGAPWRLGVISIVAGPDGAPRAVDWQDEAER